MKTKSRRRPRPVVPHHVHTALNAVLDYLWEGELKDFEARQGGRAGHIFCEMTILRGWLSPTQKKP